MIKIIADPNNLGFGIRLERMDSMAEYPLRVKDIQQAYENHQEYALIITQPVVIQWLKNMAARYPQGVFHFETIDARTALAQRWGMDIPTNLTNEDILQSGLLSSDVRPQPGFGFEDTLLSHYYTPILTSKTFPFTQLPSLLGTVDPQRWKANLAIPLLARTLHTRLEEWKSKARSSEQRQLVELFATDPYALILQLIRFRVLRSYPTIGEAVLGEAFDVFRILKLQLDDLKFEESKIPETILQVTYFLNNQQPQNSDDLVTLLDRTSGMLSVEFEIIEKHLRDHSDWITPELMDQIEEKFSGQSRQLARKIATLRGLIRPPKPETPDLSWNVDTMLSWATESYLPYQAWCNRQEQFDSDLFAIGDRFSEWLMKNWDDIHANSKRMVFNILPNKAVDLKRDGIVNLVLVIDNLGWTFSEMLRDMFQERGYFLAGAEPYLAMLPSETEISKKCLLAGAVGYQAIDDKTYKGMIEKGWVPYFKDNAFRYISDIGSLSAIETIDAASYVVNYLAIDKALHKSADEIGMSHRDHIYHLLEKLVENTIFFIEKHGLQENIRIHVVSDHGSTRIPASVQNDLDPAFFKTNGFEARSHRYVTVSSERFSGLADNLRLDCFFLPANDFMNPENVLCARRGNRFLPTDKDFYVHGGLLPEEIIVPYLVFEPATIATQDLTVLLKKNEFRYRMETVELEIGNPNDSAVDQIQVSLLNGNVESEPIRIALLNGKKNMAIQIKTRFKVTSILEEQSNLHIRIRYHAHGEQHTFDVLPKITMKKMVEEKSTSVFDD
ncbi:MAG: PglZ domain-containing protein [Anaerolineae bacterium]|nr:PglZ domain-containing protein [Anaerolineae bacterium]